MKHASNLSEDPRLRPEHDPDDALFHPLEPVDPAFCVCAMLCMVTCFCFVFRVGVRVLEMRFDVAKVGTEFRTPLPGVFHLADSF